MERESSSDLSKKTHPEAFLSSDDNLDPLHLYIKEVRQIPLLSTKEVFALGARIFSGQVALSSLKELASADNLSFTQSEKIRKILSAKGAPTLIAQFNQRLNNPPQPEKEKAYQSHQQFLEVYKKHKNQIAKQLAGIEKEESAQVKEELLDAFLDRKIALASAGAEAHKKLVQGNLRLVINYAKKLRRKAEGIHLLDLIEAGNEGLMVAAAKYDFRRGCFFSTFATSWIMLYIRREIDNSATTIRIPTAARDKLAKLKRHNGSNTSYNDEVADSAVRAESTISIHTIIGDGKDTELLDVLQNQTRSLEEAVLEDELRQTVAAAVRSLSPRSQGIINSRWGLTGGRERTLEEVGRQHNVTRERIRQIEARSLHELQKELQDFRPCDPKTTPIRTKRAAHNAHNGMSKPKPAA